MLNVINLPAIVDLRPMIVLFDKNTEQPLLQYDYSELGLMKSVYKKYNHNLNAKENFWLSDKQFKELVKLGYEKLDNVSLKVSYNETEIVLYNNVIKLIDHEYPIVLFEELVAGQKNNQNVLDKVAEKLRGKGYKIFQTRSISANFEIGNATANMLLEFLTGHKIKNDKFTLLDVSQFNEVFYYDNNSSRILYLRKINEILNLRLETSKLEISNSIKDYISNNSMILSLNTISNNEVNPISSLILKIGAITKYVKNFESWRNF